MLNISRETVARLAANGSSRRQAPLLGIVLWVFALPGGPAAAGTDEPELWREPVTGMEFVLVKGGCYEMGDTFGDGDHNERPVHEVCVDDFWLGRYEVTQAEWRTVMGENPAGFDRGDDYPVESVRLDEIEQFIARLGGEHLFRLPTEAEWEYACRARGKSLKYGTADGGYRPELANVDEPDEVDGWPETAPVDAFPPNVLGLYGMAGNLWEWVADVYATDAYTRHERLNPLYELEGPSRLVRGGAWSHEAHFARCSKRHMHCRPSVRYDIIGFRLVREP